MSTIGRGSKGSLRAYAALRAAAMTLVVATTLSCNEELPEAPIDEGATAGSVAVVRAPLVTDIHNCTELQAMSSNLDGDYRLANDIDCTTYDYGDGKGFL